MPPCDDQASKVGKVGCLRSSPRASKSWILPRRLVWSRRWCEGRYCAPPGHCASCSGTVVVVPVTVPVQPTYVCPPCCGATAARATAAVRAGPTAGVVWGDTLFRAHVSGSTHTRAPTPRVAAPPQAARFLPPPLLCVQPARTAVGTLVARAGARAAWCGRLLRSAASRQPPPPPPHHPPAPRAATYGRPRGPTPLTPQRRRTTTCGAAK